MDLKILRDTAPWDWPETTGPQLLGVLRDAAASAEDRLLASELAGDLIVADDDLVRAQLAILQDPAAPPELRAQAALSLGPALEYADTEGFEDDGDAPISEPAFQEIQAALRGVFAESSTPKEVRRRTLEAAVRAPQEWQLEAAGAAYRSGDAEWRLTAVFCMRFLRGFEKEILEAVSSPDMELKTEAIHAAGEWGLGAAWPHVAAALKGRPAKPLLLAAIAAAPQIRADEAQALLSELADADDEEIADCVQEALAMTEGPWDGDEEAR
jgi:hypothetical protein